MRRTLSAVEREKSKDGDSAQEFLDMVNELKVVGENILKRLAEHIPGIEQPDEGACAVNESARNGLRDFKARESEVSTSGDAGLGKSDSMWGDRDANREVRLKEKRLDEQLSSVTDHIEILEGKLKEVEGSRTELRKKLSEVERKERDVELMREFLSGKLKEIERKECEKLHEVEKREKEIEFMRESLSGKLKEVEKREKDVCILRGKLKEVEKREREVEDMRVSLNGQLRGIENREREVNALSEKLKRVEENVKELKALHQKLCEVEKRERQVKDMRGSLERRLREVERREKQVESLQEKLSGVEKREREFEDKHRLLDRRLREAERREKEIEILHKKLKNVEDREREVVSLQEKLSGVEKRERELEDKHRLLDRRLREAGRREKEIEILHEKLKNVEVREREVESLQEKLSGVEKRDREIEDKHRLLDRRLREAERREKENEILYEKLKNVDDKERKVGAIHESIKGRLKEVERREKEVEILHEKLKKVEKREKEVGLAHASLEGRLKDVENREKEVKILFEKSKDIEKLEKVVETMHESLERRLREVDERESEFVLSQNARIKELNSKENALNAKRNVFLKEVESANEKVKLGYGLIEKLDEALETLKRMKTTVDERFMEMESWQAATYESLSLILNEAVLAQETAEKRIVELENRERELISSKEKNMEPLLRAFLASYKIHHNRICPSTNVELNKEPIVPHLSKCVTKHEQYTDAEAANVKIDSLESVKVKNQEHETEEHVRLTGEEINKVLLYSSDAAELVLEAMQVFYSSHLVEGNVELKLWIKYLLLLDQLRKISLSITPCVKEAAQELADKWRPKVVTFACSEPAALGFLMFMAAYNLLWSSNIDELFTLLKRVAYQKNAPQLLCKLCPSKNISGFIQNLLNEKQYLLASRYIHECKLQHMFPQPAVLNSFLTQSNMLAKEIRKRGNNSSEAQVEAINVEVSNRKAAIEHITRYGLEFAFSPQVLETEIKKFEVHKVGLMKHITRSAAMVSDSGNRERSSGNIETSRSHLVNQTPLYPPKNLPIPFAEEVSSSVDSNARYPQSGDSRKRVASDFISEYDRWLLAANNNTMSHGHYNNARFNRALKKQRPTNYVPRPAEIAPQVVEVERQNTFSAEFCSPMAQHFKDVKFCTF